MNKNIILSRDRAVLRTDHISHHLYLPSGRVVKFALMAALSTPFSTANTCSLYVTSGVSPDVVCRLGLLNLTVCGVSMPAVRGVKVAL